MVTMILRVSSLTLKIKWKIQRRRCLVARAILNHYNVATFHLDRLGKFFENLSVSVNRILPMFSFTPEQFEELKSKTEALYATVGEIYCPYFNEKIVFNAKGWEHLRFQRKNHARLQHVQYVRFKLFHLASQIIASSRTIQGVLHTKNFEWIRSNARTECILKGVSYYEFIAVLEDVRVRIVVKKIESGPKFFWSIIPFWKRNNVLNIRRLYSGDPEHD